MYILGISAFYHDSAAALIHNGEIIAAAQEERFTRIKHDSSFPENAIRFCIKYANITINQIDRIVFHEKPFLKFERLIESYLAFSPRGFSSFQKSMPLWLKEKLFQKSLIIKLLEKTFDGKNIATKIRFFEHHLSHAASAFYPSPFKKAAILTLDGVGEWSTTSAAIGNGSEIKILKEIHFPHSLGLLYTAFTYYLGMKVNSGEYKVMGLAPYGNPKYSNLIEENLIDIKDDGSFWLNQNYFDYCTGLKMTNQNFDRLFGQPVRKQEAEITQFHMDIAASIQAVTEKVMLKLCRSLAKETSMRNLCLAGGVALNCVANGKILREGVFDKIWIQPAAGDAGGALGAAIGLWHHECTQLRTIQSPDKMQGSYLGPQFSDQEIQEQLNDMGAVFKKISSNEINQCIVQDLCNECATGWFQGRMEFGPRALGGRSIIADPRSPKMQKILNLKIKYRESFRPFAPSVLEEYASQWFEIQEKSPYMLFVTDVAKEKIKELLPEEKELSGIDKLNTIRSDIPAVTHIDYSARVQTVSKDTNPRYHDLISCFWQKTGCPVLVNTSFNVRGEPIVCTPSDAFRCFMGTEMDTLVIGNFHLRKQEQNKNLTIDYKNRFILD